MSKNAEKKAWLCCNCNLTANDCKCAGPTFRFRERPATLAAVLAALYADEINCGLASFWDGGWTVWIGDDLNGRKAEETFWHEEFDKIAPWLLAEAEELKRQWASNRALSQQQGDRKAEGRP